MTIYMGTTDIDSIKTVGEIQSLLAKSGARGVSITYDDQGNGLPTALDFSMPTNDMRFMRFSLPVRPERVYRLLCLGRSRINEDRMMSQAYRTAWRQIYKWVQAQLALILTEQARVEEVFMPYMLVPGKGGEPVRMFDQLVDSGKLLPVGENT